MNMPTRKEASPKAISRYGVAPQPKRANILLTARYKDKKQGAVV